MTRDMTDRAAWTITPDGVAVGGARAVGLMLAVAWGTRLVLLPWKVPGVPWVLDRCYEFIARHRRRLPGDTPWCVAHPDDCGPD